MFKILENKKFKLNNNLIFRYESILEEEGGGLFIYHPEKKSMYEGNISTYEILNKLRCPKDLSSLANEIAICFQLCLDDVLPPLKDMMVKLLEEQIVEVFE